MKKRKLCENCGETKDLESFLVIETDRETGIRVMREEDECDHCRDEKWKKHICEIERGIN